MAEPLLKEAGAKGRSVIVAISDRPAFLHSVRSSLSAVPDYELREMSIKAAVAGGGLRGRPDLVLFDVASGEVLEDERVFELRRAAGAVPFIAVSDDLAPGRMRRLVQLSASDWLRQPLQGRDLLDGIAQQLQGTRLHKSEVVAFLPCTGGAGATSLAVLAAAQLAKKESTCLVDLDFAAGACGLYLDTHSEFNVDNVINAPERIDLELLEIVKREHAAGFTLLSFRRPDLQVSAFREDFVYRLLDVVSYRYPRVVIDLPSYPTPWAEEVLRNSDQVVLVTERTVPALKRAREVQQKLLEAGKSEAQLHILINKDRRKMFSVSIGIREIHRLFQTKDVSLLPDRWDLMAEALNRGVPASSVRKRDRLVKAFGRMIGQITADKGRR